MEELKSQVKYKLELLNYLIYYTISLPTKISDYDYDPNNINRRFITTLLHDLIFCDRITNTKIVELKFSTDICDRLKYGLIKMVDNPIDEESSRPLILTVKDIYSNDMFTPSIVSLYKLPNKIQLSVLNNIDNNILIFHDMEVLELIKLLNVEI